MIIKFPIQPSAIDTVKAATSFEKYLQLRDDFYRRQAKTFGLVK